MVPAAAFETGPVASSLPFPILHSKENRSDSSVVIPFHDLGFDRSCGMLAQNRPDAAAGFVVQAIDWTQKARALGADVDLAIVLMQQVYQSLTAAWP